jgi:hypothetical protein
MHSTHNVKLNVGELHNNAICYQFLPLTSATTVKLG